ncbi:MAG: NAD(P)/FAD-dependent oxidoreductase, partial [Gemmatimonadetes bacterium HGW-Gemmatimonadetes-1]
MVVVGAGPAGLAAAVAASERGRSVLVLDQAPHAGGQVWRHRRGERPAPVLVELLRRLAARGGAIARRAAVLDCPAPGELVVDFDGRIDRITAPALVLATGAVERLLPFPGWTLPGVTGVGGLQALLKAGLALRGQRVVIAGTGPLLLPVAATVVKGGGELVMIAEQARGSQVVRFAGRALTDPARLLQALRLRMATIASPYRADSWVVAAHGEDRVRGVTVHVQGAERVIACDWLAAAAGLLPRTELAELLG